MNSTSTQIDGKGPVNIEILSNGKSINAQLNNTLPVPNLCTNLLSVVKITDRGSKVSFDRNSVLVTMDGVENYLQSNVLAIYIMQQERCNTMSN